MSSATLKVIKKQLPPFTLQGVSRAGISTCFCIPELKLALDVAQGLPFAVPMQTFLITHAHMDHASGIPYIISQKALAHHNPARFFMPESMVTPMLEIMESWQKMEGHRYDFDFIPLKPEQKLELNTRHSFTTFRSDHRVPTLGYILYEKRKKLRPEFEGLSTHSLREAKRTGQTIEEHLEVPLLAFTGDTGIRVLDQVPELHRVRYLIIEVTYAGDKKGIEKAEKWGHIHLDQILPYLEKLECEKLIFSHWSMSHRTSEVHKLIKALPERERKRIITWL